MKVEARSALLLYILIHAYTLAHIVDVEDRVGAILFVACGLTGTSYLEDRCRFIHIVSAEGHFGILFMLN